MKRWTFFDQTLVSFVVIFAASFAAALLHWSVLGHLAFLLVGAAYVIRAVPPVCWDIQLGREKARWLTRLMGTLFILYGLFAHF